MKATSNEQPEARSQRSDVRCQKNSNEQPIPKSQHLHFFQHSRHGQTSLSMPPDDLSAFTSDLCSLSLSSHPLTCPPSHPLTSDLRLPTSDRRPLTSVPSRPLTFSPSNLFPFKIRCWTFDVRCSSFLSPSHPLTFSPSDLRPPTSDLRPLTSDLCPFPTSDFRLPTSDLCLYHAFPYMDNIPAINPQATNPTILPRTMISTGSIMALILAILVARAFS